LDYCLAAEDDVGCADYLGTPGDFVSCVLEGRGLAFLRKKGVCREEEEDRTWKDIQSMYSPFTGFLDMVATC